MSSSSLSFQPSCPSGGNWYACGNGVKFVGCCTVNPCTSTGCPSSSLKPASFLASASGKFPDQTCTSGSWYSCALINPTFLGCCTSNPCQPGGCPSINLRAGALSEDVAIANRYNPSPALSSSSSSTRTTSSTTTSSRLTSTSTTTSSNTSSRTSTTTTTSSSTLTRSSSTSSSTTKSSSTNAPIQSPVTQVPKGAIAGAVVGGVVVLAIIISAILFVWRMRRHTKHQRESQVWLKPLDKKYEPLAQADNSYPPSQTDYEYPPQQRKPLSSYSSYPVHTDTSYPGYVDRSSAVSPLRSPSEGYYGHASREMPQYVPYSPTRFSAPPEPRYDTSSGVYGVPDSSVRIVQGNDGYRRAELG